MPARHLPALLLLLALLALLLGAAPFPGEIEPLPSKNPAFELPAGCARRLAGLERTGEGQPGQTEWRARFYEIEGEIDFAGERLLGTVRAHLTPVAAVDHLVLDAFDSLSEIAVRVDGAAADWTRLDARTIDIATPGASVGVESVVEVDYIAAENPVGYGAFWFPYYVIDGDTTRVCQTMTETQNAGAWWPCIDRLTHKPDSVALAITVPDTMIVASNGTLDLLEAPGDGTRTYHWRERHPVATYLVSITVAPFHSPGGDGLPWTEDYDLGGGATMPLQYFIRPHNLGVAQHHLPWLADMMDAFRARFGEYPFVDEKYGIAEYSFLGGMEHQTISSIGTLAISSSDSVNFVQPHELAHQWFGDRVSPASWEDIWLNEGFATYGEALYYEHFGRYTAGEYLFERRRPSDDELFSGSIYDPIDTFGRTVYWKGAWALHMLRQLVGDAEFFGLLAHWAALEHLDGIATTDQFIAAARDFVTSVDDAALDAFFERWIYGTGRPIYGVEWDASQSGDWRFDLIVQQVQSGAPFSDSLDVRVSFAGGLPDSTLRIAPASGFDAYAWSFAGEPTALTLDPEHRLLFNQVELPATSGPLTLYAPYPNPSGGGSPVSIRLALREGGDLRVGIYDVAGRRVADLSPGESAPGLVTLAWDGRDDAGESQANGVYFVRAQMNGRESTGKLLHLPLR